MRLIRKNVERVANTEAQIEKLKAQGFRPINGDSQGGEQAPLDITAKTVTELRAFAKEKEIEGYSSLTKDELLAVLKDVV